MKSYCLVLILTVIASLSASASNSDKATLYIFEGAWSIDSAKFELNLTKNTPLCEERKVVVAAVSSTGTSSFLEYSVPVQFGLCKYSVSRIVGKYSCFPDVTDFRCKPGTIELNFNIPGGISYGSLQDEYPGKKIIMSNTGYEKVNFNHDISKTRDLVLFPKAWEK